MKKSMFFVLSFLFAANISVAQNSILAGKIVDENNKPVGGAMVQMQQEKTDEIYKTVSDGDGLYYSPLVPIGIYKVSVLEREKWYKAKKITLDETDRLTKFYQLRLKGDDAVVTMLDHDPFMRAALYKVINNGPRIDVPGSHMLRMRVDSTGRLIPADGKRDNPGRR
jgi:hypothetical protein